MTSTATTPSTIPATAFGAACTVAWTELRLALRADGHQAADSSGPAVRAWLERMVGAMFETVAPAPEQADAARYIAELERAVAAAGMDICEMDGADGPFPLFLAWSDSGNTPVQRPASIASPTAEDGWLQSGPLLYRLTDERRPKNRDEIAVMMVDGSRDDAARARRASQLLALLTGASEHLAPGPGNAATTPLRSGRVIELANQAFHDQPGGSCSRKDNDLFYLRFAELLQSELGAGASG